MDVERHPFLFINTGRLATPVLIFFYRYRLTSVIASDSKKLRFSVIIHNLFNSVNNIICIGIRQSGVERYAHNASVYFLRLRTEAALIA